VTDLRIELLGGFRVVVQGRAVADGAWSQRKPAALLKLLALAPGRRLRREQVMDLLWPELDPSSAAANLRKALHSVRRTLGDRDGEEWIVSVGELLCLAIDGLSVDVEEYRSAAAAARRTRDVDAFGGAIEVYRDDLLPEDVYEEWAVAVREELRLDWLGLVEEFARLLEASGELNEASRAVRRLITADPLREDNHAWLMRLHALAGRRDEAGRQYERLRDLLQDELSVEPSLTTQRLIEEIRGDQTPEPELTADLWERVGDLRMQSGDVGAAAKAFGQSLAASPGSAMTARLHRKCANAWLVQHLPDEAEPHLDAADRLAPDRAEQGRLACARASLARERGDLTTARRLAEQAYQIAHTEQAADDVAAALEVLAIISHIQGDWRSGLQAQIERFAANNLGERAGQVCDIHHCIAQYQLYGDGLASDVEDYARTTLALAERMDAVPAQAFAWCLLGESLLLHARWDEAAACLERSCELYEALGSRSVALPWLRRAELAVCVGAHEDVAGYLTRATAIATVTPMAQHAWGRLHATAAFAAVEAGDPERATRSVRAAQGTAARYGDCLTCGALLNPVGAQAFALVGDRAGAAECAAAAAQLASSFGSSAWNAMAESAAGSVALADGDRAGARERFQAAATLYEQADHTFWASRLLAQAASLQ
jgi:DNA-binding SARP family transcriptional activator